MVYRVLHIDFFEFLNECQRLRWLCEAIVNENLQNVLTDKFPKIYSIIPKLYTLDGPLPVIEKLFPYHDTPSKLQKFNDELKDSFQSEKERKENVTNLYNMICEIPFVYHFKPIKILNFQTFSKVKSSTYYHFELNWPIGYLVFIFLSF